MPRWVPMNGGSRVNDIIRNGRRATYIGLQRLQLLPRSEAEGDCEAQLLSAPPPDARERKARVVADCDDDEDHEEEQQVGVTPLPPPKPHRQARCCPRHRRMQEEERPESWPIVMMVKIMK